MNIIVSSRWDKFSCRPDTTWERENKDIYRPDFIESYDYAPILFARICKAGKCVQHKFADRYYDSYNYGVLLYPKVHYPSTPPFRTEVDPTILDHSSLLPAPLYDKITLGQDNEFSLLLDGKEIFHWGDTVRDKDEVASIARVLIGQTISEASEYISLRIGDFVAVELAYPEPLCEQGHLQAFYCENPTIDVHIK